MEANQDKIVVLKVFAPWCKACKALGPRFLSVVNDKKYAKFPVLFADLSVVANKDFVKKIGVVALPSVQFYAGTDGLVDNFPCGPSKVGILKRKLAQVSCGNDHTNCPVCLINIGLVCVRVLLYLVLQLIRERVDPKTLGLKEVEKTVEDDEESQPCAERSILDETAKEETEFMVAGVKVSEEQMDFLRNGVPYFKDFSDEEFFGLMKKARLQSFDPGNVIMKEGKRGRTFYVIQSGEVDVYVHAGFEDPLTTPPNYLGAMVNRLKKGDYFGERALITGERRAASIRAEVKTRCFAFDIKDIPASSVLSGQGNASEDRIREVNNKYGVDVRDMDLVQLTRQLEAAKLGSQVRGSVNSPERIKGVDFEDDSPSVPKEISIRNKPVSLELGVTNEAIIPLLLRFKLVRHAARCFDYISEMRPKWGDPGTRRRRTKLLEMLTESQREEFTEVFKLVDASGDNVIHLLELKRVMESIGEDKTDEELQDMIKTGGNSALNGEEVISYDDFMGIMAEAEFYNLFKDTFKSLDKEESGFVKASDLERVLCGMQGLMSDDRASIINVEDMDMMISYEQFSSMLLGTAGL